MKVKIIQDTQIGWLEDSINDFSSNNNILVHDIKMDNYVEGNAIWHVALIMYDFVEE
jgi:hypothetical protein